MICSTQENQRSRTKDVTEQCQSIAPNPVAGGSRRRWYFSRSVLDERTHELLVDGVDAELERKPLEVLLYLLHHADEVCTKDELLAAVWPGRVLSETVLTKCIGRLRDALADDEQEIIKTAYGFGYRFVAPVRIETVAAQEPARFDLKVGMHIPSRPLWCLIERLGVGGNGEAWRARQEKTNEQRVFKFALEEAALVALKREITLFRVINDTLGSDAKVAKIIDWNLERIPYFLEAEYAAGGSLVSWAATCGGLSRIPLADRLELVAKIADALAAVHSVGVLHKDLKPSNVLIRPVAGNSADALLADFGSGGVLDVGRLDQLGITRLGFTKTISSLDSSSGTPLYLAPEVLAGQPFTVKSDVYALGMILFQMVTGDFHAAMSPGWERNVDDELLRDDIASMAEGNPTQRIGDAETLSRRLRTLGERRMRLVAERDALLKADKDRRLLDQTRARRFGMVLALSVLVAGTVSSTYLYIRERQAQARTALAAAESTAVTEFLTKHVFAPVSSGAEAVKGMTVLDLLRRAGEEIDHQFQNRPEIASELHFVIGRSFHSFLESPLAAQHFRRALDLGEHLEGLGSRSAMKSASEMIRIDYLLGQLPQTLPRYTDVLSSGTKRFDPDIVELVELRMNVALGHYLIGDWATADQLFRSLLADEAKRGAEQTELLGRSRFYYGQLLTDLAKPAEAIAMLRDAIGELKTIYGEKHSTVVEARSALGRALADTGNYSEAKAELDQSHELSLPWAPQAAWIEVRPRFFSALLFLQEDRPSLAEPILAEIVKLEDDGEAEYLATHQDSAPELDHTGPVRQALGEVYLRQNKWVEALAALQRAVLVEERASGSQHPLTISAKLSLTEALIASQRGRDAESIYGAVPATILQSLPPTHPIVAEWYRMRGLFALGRSDLGEARQSLNRTKEIYTQLYGRQYWRSVRARRELLLADAGT